MVTIKIVCLVVLLAAAIKDVEDRIIPNWMPGLIAVLSFYLPEGPQFSGLLVALPLLLAACLWGGIGGGDIKLMAALGLVFGFWVCFWGLIIALVLLIAYHLARKIKKIPTGALYPMVPFLFVGIVFGCLFV